MRPQRRQRLRRRQPVFVRRRECAITRGGRPWALEGHSVKGQQDVGWEGLFMGHPPNASSLVGQALLWSFD